MPVALLPPITSGPHRDPNAVPLNAGPRYVRGPGNSRWHRARAGVQRPERTTWTLWCGPHISDHGATPASRLDEIPAGEPVCGTCVGRALGAGQDDAPEGLPELVFSPRWLSPPRWCPGSRSQRLIGEPPLPAQGSVGVCLACGDLVAVRASTRVWYGGYGLIQHAAGPGLLPGCPFHAWQFIDLRAPGRAGCGCGWHDVTEVGLRADTDGTPS